MNYGEVYAKYVTSGKKYMCYDGRTVHYDDRFRDLYYFCTDNISIIQVADKINTDSQLRDVYVLWAKLGWEGRDFLHLAPPFRLSVSALVYLAMKYAYNEPVVLSVPPAGERTVNVRPEAVPVTEKDTVQWCLTESILSYRSCPDYGVVVES